MTQRRTSRTEINYNLIIYFLFMSIAVAGFFFTAAQSKVIIHFCEFGIFKTFLFYF